MAEDAPVSWGRVGISVLLCVLALVVGAAGFATLASLKEPPAVREPVEKTYNVQVFEVQQADLREIVSAFGTARADRQVVLAAQVGGEIVEVHPRLKVGEPVEAAGVTVGDEGQSRRSTGDLLVRIDPQTYAERVAQAQSRLAEDRAELERLRQEEANTLRLLETAEHDRRDVQKEYDDIRKLAAQGVATESKLRQVQLQLRQYERTILQYETDRDLFPVRREQIERRQESHEADLRLAQLDLARSEVRPPFPGRLSEVLVEIGQFVRPGDALVRLTDDTLVEIPVPVTLEDYARILPAVQSGELPRVALAENETAPPKWYGEVIRVAPRADELTRTIELFVQVDNREQAVPLLPGTFVHARIDGPILERTLAVPRDSIMNGKVYVAVDGKAEERPVRVARTLQTLALIEAGIENGEQVILTNLDIIHQGAQVQVQSRQTLADELLQQRTPTARQAVAGGEVSSDTMN